jgi:predicted nucleic acid-binding protein
MADLRESSALIKLVFDEPDSELAAELWDRADPETCAALAAAARARRISESTHVSAVAALEDLYAELRVIAIHERLARQAGDLAGQLALRGYDAIHLASALNVEGDDVLLATWDNALSSAARATGPEQQALAGGLLGAMHLRWLRTGWRCWPIRSAARSRAWSATA